jgi:flagellar biosynthetic protein FliP
MRKFIVFLLFVMLGMAPIHVYAAAVPQPEDISELTVENSNGEPVRRATEDINNGFAIIYNNDEGSLAAPIRILIVITVLSIAPAIVIMLTSFTRIIVALHFLRTAMGTNTAPPNQVLVGLALFLTFFIMYPTFSQINENAIQPLDRGEITQEEAMQEAIQPLRDFMLSQAKEKDIDLFCEIGGITYETPDDIPNMVLIPGFILSELRQAFVIGFLIYIPFIVIDMVVSSVLMSMGMMMLPPTTISLPFKVLLFILADGWDLVIGNVVKTFY